jgi:hypothetical protein
MRLCGRNRANLVKRVPVPIPTLNLDFVNGLYQFGNNKYTTPNGITGYSFGNSTGGTVFNPNTGLVQTFAPNVPRITSNGLLVEGQGRNLCLSSERLQNATIWNYTFLATVTDGTITAPNGTLTGSTVVTSDPGSEIRFSNVPVTTNQNYTLSFWVRLGTGASASKQIKIATTGGSQIGALGSLAGANATTWTRVSLTVNVGANSSVLVYPLAGTGTAGTYYIWGVQFELGTTPTSYIPTYYSAITNICQYSNNLATSPWTASGIIATNNNALAPDGSFTASLLNVTLALSTIRQSVTVTASTPYTFSFYAKRGTATDVKYSVYNITASSEIIIATSYYNQINSNNWTRVSITFTTPVGCTNVGIYPMRDSQQLGTTFIWGCQLQLGNTATKFIPVSPAVTNYCLFSQQIGGTGWTPASCTPTLNNTAAPDGTTTATLMTSTTATASALYRTAYTTTVGNQIITNSCWVKAGTNRYCTLNSNNGGSTNAVAIFDLVAGVVTKTNTAGIFSNLIASITPDPRGNGWFRIAVSFTCANSGIPITIQISNSALAQAPIDAQGNVSAANGTTIFMWGAQQELGYGPNQYVLTTTASATAAAQTSATQAILSSFTRTPDVLIYGSTLGLSFANTKSMITEGSFLYYPSTNFALAQLSDGTSSNSVLLGQYLDNFLSQIVIGGSLVKSIFQGGKINEPPINRKQGVSFGDNRMVISQNGGAVTDPNLGNGTFAGTISFNQILIGGTNTVTNPQMFGYVRSIKLYPSSLSLNQLNTLTSLQNN